MNPKILELYKQAMNRDIQKAIDGRLTGNIEFRFNFREGVVNNVNCGLNKSYRFTEQDVE